MASQLTAYNLGELLVKEGVNPTAVGGVIGIPSGMALAALVQQLFSKLGHKWPHHRLAERGLLNVGAIGGGLGGASIGRAIGRKRSKNKTDSDEE